MEQKKQLHKGVQIFFSRSHSRVKTEWAFAQWKSFDFSFRLQFFVVNFFLIVVSITTFHCVLTFNLYSSQLFRLLLARYWEVFYQNSDEKFYQAISYLFDWQSFPWQVTNENVSVQNCPSIVYFLDISFLKVKIHYSLNKNF